MTPDTSPGDPGARLERALAAFQEAALRRIRARHGGPASPDAPAFAEPENSLPPGAPAHEESANPPPPAAPAEFRSPPPPQGFFRWLFSIGRNSPPEG